MAFPRRALLVAAVTALLLYLFDFPFRAAVGLCLVVFLITGRAYLRLFVKTFPRDLWMGRNLARMLFEAWQHRRQRKILSDIFEQQVEMRPEKIAVILANDSQTWTFKQLNNYANSVANYFSRLGVQPGETVALFMENSPEYLGLCLGLWKMGAVAALINHNLRQESLLHCIRAGKTRSLVCSSSLSGAVMDVIKELSGGGGGGEIDTSKMCFVVGGEQEVGGGNFKNLNQELKTVSTSQPPPLKQKTPDDKACYVYTSGTTGLPKACVIKHSRFYYMANGIHLFGCITSDDVIYNSLPLYHSNGGILSAGQMLFWGSTLVLRKKFSASNFFVDCVKHKCTVMFHIGELCRYLMAQPRRPTDTQHCLRLAVGNGLRLQIWNQFQKRFFIRQIVEFYGSTEGNANVINYTGKPGACGILSVVLSFLNPMVLLKVDENGKHVRDANGYCVRAEIGERGEVVGAISVILTHRRFDGYEDKKATSKKILCNALKPGDKYFLSGDIMKMDEEGYLYFCDRTGDTFRWKGENVSTMEVEGVIQQILDHRDVTVYGVEVPGMEGRAGMAAIAGGSEEEDVDLAKLLQQLSLSLPAYALPQFVRLNSEVSTTGTLKLKKVGLRNDGFDLEKVSDPLFFLHPQHKAYVPLTPEIHSDITNGTIRL